MRNDVVHILVGSAVFFVNQVRFADAGIGPRPARVSVDDWIMFTVEITSLGPGLHSLEFEPEVEAVDLDPERFRHVHVDVRLDVHEGRMLVTLKASAVATLECDRTLTMFDQEISGTYHMLFAPPEFIEHQEDAYDEVRALHPSDQKIDVTEVVRDTILLSIPHRCVAPGAEEVVIETEFGAPEDGVDPRWEALRRLKSGAGDD